MSLPMHVLELAAFAQYSNAEEKLVSASRMAGLLRRHAQANGQRQHDSRSPGLAPKPI